MLPINKSVLSLAATTIIGITPIVAIINNYAFDDHGKLICDKYVLISYIYVVLGFALITIGALLEQQLQIMPRLFNTDSLMVAIVAGIGLLLSLIGLSYYVKKSDPQENLASIHLAFILYCILIGMMICITLVLGARENVLNTAIFATLCIVSISGYIGYTFGNSLISVDFDKYLKYSLIAFIIWIIIAPFIIADPVTRIYTTSGPGLIIFILLIFSYNNQLRKNQDNCIVPNYPGEAIGLIIKITNTLTSIVRLLSARKGR